MKKLICLLLAAVMVLSMAACGAPADDSNPNETKGGSAENKSGEVVELRFMDIIPNPQREAVLQKLIGEFNEKNPDIKVVYESVPWDEAHNKVITQGGAGDMPDMLNVASGWLAEFTGAGWIIPLDEYLTKWGKEDTLLPYVKNVLMDYDQKQVYGHVYGVPEALTTHGIYVRTDWLEEAGLTLDDLSTWEGVFDAAIKMTNPEKNQYGFTFRGARAGAEQMAIYVLGELNGKLYEDDGTCRLNTEVGIEAFKHYCDMYIKGYAPADSINWGYAEMVQGFTSGLSGVMNQTAEVTAVCADSMQDGTWTVVPFPTSTDGYRYSKADGNLVSISRDCKHPDEAWRFFEFMMEFDHNVEYSLENVSIPIIKGAENDPRFTEGPMEGFVKSMDDKFVRVPYYGYFPELGEFQETIFDQEMQKYLLGQQTAEEAYNNVAAFLTDAQQRYMAEHPEVPIPGAVRADGTVVK